MTGSVGPRIGYSMLRSAAIPVRLRSGGSCLLAVVLLLACHDDAPNPPGGERPPHVILFMLDAARADHLSSYGYSFDTTPHIDALAEKGALFEHHYAGNQNTRKSLPTLMLGRYVAPPLFGFSRDISRVQESVG